MSVMLCVTHWLCKQSPLKFLYLYRRLIAAHFFHHLQWIRMKKGLWVVIKSYFISQIFIEDFNLE